MKFRAPSTSVMRLLPMRWLVLAMLAAWAPSSRAALSAEAVEAVAWYDTLGFPDTKDLPYVRVATGWWSQSGNQPPKNRFVEGFLLGENVDGFTVFICSVSDFTDRFAVAEPLPPLTISHFIRNTAGPVHKHVDYEVLDFSKASFEVLDRVRSQALNPASVQWGRPLTHRARIFAFARACLQKGFSETASALMNVAANIPDEQNGQAQPLMLREMLQRQIGAAVLSKAEVDCGNPSKTWAELLTVYEDFHMQFPASEKIAYAREAADALRSMIADEAEHHPKPLEQMSPAEEVAENIYQLRNLSVGFWIMNSHYPLSTREPITPVHRLVDFGDEAVPQLIEALDDRRFTRSMVPAFKGWAEPKVMRVGDVAQRILEHMSGRNLFASRTDDGKLVNGTTREKAEAWWAEMQSKGEKQLLIETAASGGTIGCKAARKLVEKYPDAAIDAIITGIRATTHEGVRGAFVEVAGRLPGERSLAFLRSNLAPTNGLFSQVKAAEALFARGQPAAVPAMIEAWWHVQPRLLADDSDAYSEVGGLITFLAKSGHATAVNALGRDVQKNPVDVRLAIVQVFLPWPKRSRNCSSIGKGVHVQADIPKLPTGAAGLAIERLLVSALDDTERRFELKGEYDEVSYEDPRVCDMAALVLSTRWPEKYQFQWAANSAESDAQIAKLRDRWRSENGRPRPPGG